jgi:hypothetical protein
MQRQEGQSTGETPRYLSKSVMVNGQSVTLYSVNGITWLSSTEELHEVMDRLDNTRIRLNDPKGEATPLAPKPTAARYRLRGPKSRPILEQEGRRITGTAIPEDPVARPQYRLDIDLDGSDEGESSGSVKAPKLARKGRSGGDSATVGEGSPPAPVSEHGRVTLTSVATPTPPKGKQAMRAPSAPVKKVTKSTPKEGVQIKTAARAKAVTSVGKKTKERSVSKSAPAKKGSKGSSSRPAASSKTGGRKPAAGKVKAALKRAPVKKATKKR